MEGKHAKKFVWETPEAPKVISYDVPDSDYLKNKITALEKKNERIRKMYKTLESSYMAECSETEFLRNMLESKDAKIEKIEATILRLAVGD